MNLSNKNYCQVVFVLIISMIVSLIVSVSDPKSITILNYSMRNETIQNSWKQTNSKINHQLNHSWTLQPDDLIYRSGSWDGAPIVVEKYKLIFFTVAKVGCTVWKQLFRRIMGYPNWKAWNWKTHDPRINGLSYLYYYSLTEANDMLQSPEWTKAIFVRDPSTRILSAYLDKGRRHNGSYVQRHCCPPEDLTCGWRASQSFQSFLQIILVEYSNRTQCIRDPHWMRMTDRLPHPLLDWLESSSQQFKLTRQLQQKYSFLDSRLTNSWFVGHMESLAIDARRLLQRIGAWEDFGATGWGKSKHENRSSQPDGIFEFNSASHSTAASQLLSAHYDSRSTSSSIQKLVFNFYALDYNISWFGFRK
jgi:hypothetical protein